MSVLRKFKGSRALPLSDATHVPPFQLASNKPVQQCATTTNGGLLTNAYREIALVHIDGNTWGDEKFLHVYTAVSVTAAVGAAPNPVGLIDMIQANGGTNTNLGVAVNWNIVFGTVTYVQHRVFRRASTIIQVYDVSEQAPIPRLGNVTGPSSLLGLVAPGGGWNFTQPITLGIGFQSAVPLIKVSVQALWCYAIAQRAISKRT